MRRSALVVAALVAGLACLLLGTVRRATLRGYAARLGLVAGAAAATSVHIAVGADVAGCSGHSCGTLTDALSQASRVAGVERERPVLRQANGTDSSSTKEPPVAAALEQQPAAAPTPSPAGARVGVATVADAHSRKSPKPFPVATGGFDPSKRSKAFPELTAGLLASVAHNGTVLVTWANYHYLDFVTNWVYHLRLLGVRNFVVGSMDDDLANALREREVPTFAMRSGLSTKDFGWGSSQFHKMGREKISLVSSVLDLGFNVLVCDVDTVWMRDPNPYIEQYPTADVLFSSDHLHSTKMGVKGGLEDPLQAAGAAANIGILLFRGAAKGMVAEWDEWLQRDPKIWDQDCFNRLLKKGMDLRARGPEGVFKAYQGKLRVGIFPVHTFCNGHTFFVQRLPQKYNARPYVAHATFQFAGTEGKRHRFREAKLWYDPPEYYNRKQGYLMFDMNLPKNLTEGIEPSGARDLPQHFELVNYQMRMVRDAVAIASYMNRALIMPKLWCGYDRVWFPHNGIFPGSELSVPFLCPMDHIFEIGQWLKQHPQSSHGPNVEMREHSFLSNPRTPDSVKTGVVDLPVPAGGLTEQDAVALAEKHSGTPVLRVRSIRTAWKGFATQAAKERFQTRTRPFTSIWCCLVPASKGRAGHVWYDMWHDEWPRRDRHHRKWNGPWEIRFGP
eukprot:TRINITY_DN13793_c0_g1_i1.p1 TRINITY_DN13793_c0_g1~~TRINITY_DN13793_c0_g1_i1.p1  ORF type:complete len:673 (+),score=122.97 TRINITY_DN13793_c0_g1_i1:96-2114(+)